MAISIYALLPLVIIVLVFARRSANKSRQPLPPGPKPLPLIGNAHQFPRRAAWVTFEEWKKEFGDVVYVNILGKPTIVLNSHKACADLLDKRSAIHSSRPHVVMMGELMGFDWSISLMPYSHRLRQHRRLFHQYFNEAACKNYIEIQEQTLHAFLPRLLKDPKNFLDHIRLLFADAILCTVYGIRAKSFDDELVTLVEKTVHAALQANIPGRFLVDLIPALKYVPAWMPGADFQREAIRAKKLATASRDLPAQYAQKNTINHGLPNSNVFLSMVEKCKEEPGGQEAVNASIEVAKSTAAIAYIGGADTTLSSIQAFFLAMANYPEVQRAGQAELDAKLGKDHLPSFKDAKDLPYISAIVTELLRWHNALPTSLPHFSTEEDVYDGYYIPKGTIIFPNLWSILHDPAVYPEPEKFNPSRWLVETPEGVKLNESMPGPEAVFGYGRRVCPGRFFAENALLLTVAKVLACFNIAPLDQAGNPCEKIPEEFQDGILVYPAPYKVSISPRSENISHILKDIAI